jgi:carbonic anhydrase/acetyltransferase-like protein (isoleucine patch superfamily)
MGATLLDGVVMEPGSIVAAGAVVPPGAWAGAVLHSAACTLWILCGYYAAVYLCWSRSHAVLWPQSHVWRQAVHSTTQD